jgi:hypothetical protein
VNAPRGELLRRTDHGVQLLYDKDDLSITVGFPHKPCDVCHAELRELRAWLDSRGLLQENTN